MTYINIHRHGPAVAGEFGLENIYKNFDHSPAAFFSAGLHPWYINEESWQADFAALQNITGKKNMLAIGECGLDKVCNTDYNLQKEVFKAQVQLANSVHKPLIIHSVRAHDDVLQLLKKEGNTVPVIFHGYNKNLALADKIISNGHYLSFGSGLGKEPVRSVFAMLPLHHLFLETDNNDITITEIYQLAAEIKQVSTEELNLQLQQNLKQVFNIEL